MQGLGGGKKIQNFFKLQPIHYTNAENKTEIKSHRNYFSRYFHKNKKEEERERQQRQRDCTITNQKRINNFATYRNFAPSYLHAAVSGGWLMCKKTQTAQSLVGQNISGTMLLKYQSLYLNDWHTGPLCYAAFSAENYTQLNRVEREGSDGH